MSPSTRACESVASARSLSALRIATLTILSAACGLTPTRADVLHLRTGGAITGELLDRSDGQYRMRTTVGVVTIDAESVVSFEEGPSPFEEYERRKAKAPDTEAGQLELADWLGEQGLTMLRKQHLQRALEINPQSDWALRGLGYVRVNGIWVDGRSLERAAARPAKEDNPGSRPAPEEDPERLVAAIQSQWRRQIWAIFEGSLKNSSQRLQKDGRAKILAIEDPLAILPLTRVLSEGSRSIRELLVEALTHFPHDEATMNLAVMAISDDDAGVRTKALNALSPRNDPRVIAMYRESLQNGSDRLVRRTAEALGRLRATEATPELIAALRAQRRRWVEAPSSRYLGVVQSAFNRTTQVNFGGRTVITYQPLVGVAFAGSNVFSDTEYQLRDVTVFRTEVLEALKQITGQNFGFDEAAWRRWLEEQKP